jgi:membrane protease YdiL (CAAX protease family)
MSHGLRVLTWAIATYVAWVGATYLLEGLPRTLLRPEAEALRALYAVLANLLVGVGGSGLVLARMPRQQTTPPAWAGINPPRRAIAMACVGLAAGATVYGLQSPPPRALTTLVNGFTQVLPVSAAEVLVCWAVPSTVAAVWRFPDPPLTRLVVIVPGSILFGLYHIAHSPPFNTPSVILFLAAVGLMTGVFFLASGDLWATVLFHNFLALPGVLTALERSAELARQSRVQAPLVALALMTLSAVGAVHHQLRRSRHSRR